MSVAGHHDPKWETAFSKIEGAAKEAAARLMKKAAREPAGFYSLIPSSSTPMPDQDFDLDVNGVPVIGVGERAILPEKDRMSLSRFIIFSYLRSPRIEGQIDKLLENIQAGVSSEIERLHGASMARSVSKRAALAAESIKFTTAIDPDKWAIQLNVAYWWLVKVEGPKSFVLGDMPVISSLAIGYEPELITPLFANFVIALPIAHNYALIVSAKPVIAGVGGKLDIAGWINACEWNRAERYAVANSDGLIKQMLADSPRINPTAMPASSQDGRMIGVELIKNLSESTPGMSSDQPLRT